MAGETNTFKEAYGVLQRHAETLRTQSEPNIDDLLSIVEESVSAYKVCKARIDAVEKALQKALTDVSEDEGTRPDAPGSSSPSNASRPRPPAPRGPATPQASKSGFDDTEDDIPF